MIETSMQRLTSVQDFEKTKYCFEYTNQSALTAGKCHSLKKIKTVISNMTDESVIHNMDNLDIGFYENKFIVEYFAILDMRRGRNVKETIAESERYIDAWLDFYSKLSSEKEFYQFVVQAFNLENKKEILRFTDECIEKYRSYENDLICSYLNQLKTIIEMHFPYEDFEPIHMEEYQRDYLKALINAYKIYSDDYNLDQEVIFAKLKG